MIAIVPGPFWFSVTRLCFCLFLFCFGFFPFAGALAHTESAARTIWWAMVLSKGMERMIHLALIHGRTGARVPSQLLPPTKPVRSRAKGKCARLPSSPTPTVVLTSPAARCSRFSGLRPCFATASLTCGICLYPAATAVAFYSRINNDAHRCGSACRFGKWLVLAARCTPTTRVEATWQTRLVVLPARRQS